MTIRPLESTPASGVLLAASKDRDAKLVFLSVGAGDSAPLAVKVPVNRASGHAVEAEGRALVEIRRLPLDRALLATVPRFVRLVHWDDVPVLVTTGMPGRSMRVGYHEWRHTARRRRVHADLSLAGDWLGRFQHLTERAPVPVTWADDVLGTLQGRWDGHPSLDAAVAALRPSVDVLSSWELPVTAVHGDFWFGNVLVDSTEWGMRVSGVVDWESASPQGCPLQDLARFAISYPLYLDRHVRPGHQVPGHRGLRRTEFGVGVRYALLGRSWMATEVQHFVGSGLTRLGAPSAAWYDVGLLGVAEVAATASDDDFAEEHLAMLAGLPSRHQRC